MLTPKVTIYFECFSKEVNREVVRSADDANQEPLVMGCRMLSQDSNVAINGGRN